jgi:hypothetical protein
VFNWWVGCAGFWEEDSVPEVKDDRQNRQFPARLDLWTNIRPLRWNSRRI